MSLEVKEGEELLLNILEKKDSFRLKIEKGIALYKQQQTIRLRDISLYHIEELTFEEDFPRREAFENVISSLRIDGVIFVYLLVGDTNGISFYFGIAKDLNYSKELELDIDDIGKHLLKSNIEGNFRGSKVVEVTTAKKQLIEKILKMKRFAKLEGVPNIDKDNEDFQGIDRLIDVMTGDEFALLLLANPLDSFEIESLESSLHSIYNKLYPLGKISLQETKGSSKTTGTSKGKSHSIAKTENSGISVTETKGTSHGTSTTESSNSSLSSSSNSTNDSVSESIATSKSDGKSDSKTEGTSLTCNKSKTTNTGNTQSREFTNKIANEWIEYIDEILLKRVDYGRNKGIFNTAVYLMANYKGTLLKLGNTMRSLFSGNVDNKVPLQLKYIEDSNEIESLKNFQIPFINIDTTLNHLEARTLLSKSNQMLANWFSAKELSVIASLPKKEVVGLPLKEEVEFGLNIIKHNKKSEELLFLGNMVQSGKVLNIDVSLDKNDLNKHTFIAGVTGSGKTTTCQRILESAKLPFMVIEPAKTEYRVMLSQRDDILIFTLGDDRVAPFRLNPFEFFKHESITSRVDMIKANIEAAFDMEAAIPQIIEAALYSCYEAYGWDIATSKNEKFDDPFADGVFAFPTLSDLIKQVEKTVEEQGFDERLKNDYIGSIKARLQGLVVGAKGFMLNTARSIDFIDLMERNVVLELEEIKNGGEKSLVMGFVLININEAIKAKYKEYKKQNKDFQHITLIEEAHRLLSKYTAGDNPNKKLGVETFADMLAEVRKYGESLIIVDQIPNKLTPEVLKNTNTKIVHKIFAQDDKEAIGNTMALDDDQKRFLSNLEPGRAIVSNQNFAKPIQVQIKELDNMSTTSSKIVEDKHIRNIALEYYCEHYKRGMILGLELNDTKPSIEEIEEFLGLRLEGLTKEWEIFIKSNKYEFSKNLKNFLQKNRLDKKLKFVAHYLTQKFYKDEEGYTKEDKKNYLLSFLEAMMNNGKHNFSRDDRRILRLK